MPKSYRVHEFAKLAGVTVKALRHYDRLGLLRPVRNGSGYRLYRLSDLARLHQIVALKSIGLPLKHIRTLLERNPLPLRAALRQQREVLEDKRRLLDRAIRALADADCELVDDDAASTTAILQRLIAVTEVQDLNVMRKYYSDGVWELWRHHYDDWPPEEWRILYRDIVAALDSDPAGPTAQALADRWLKLHRQASPNAAVRSGLMKAWADREHWPVALRRRIAEFDIERATRFISEAVWERWDADRRERERAGAPGPPRVTEARRALYRDCAALLGSEPSSSEARAIVARWRSLIDGETGGDEEIRHNVLDAFSRRHQWPAGMQRYMASLYEMDVATWHQVADFIQRAASSPTDR